MCNASKIHRFLAGLIVVLSTVLATVAAFDEPVKPSPTKPVQAAVDPLAKSPKAEEADTTPPRILLRGKVVLARAALKKRGIKVAEEMQDQAVLETSTGELIPIAADWRGRAFYQDKRLRDRPVELVGYRQAGIPYLQILVIFFFNEQNEREEMDYWCDICSIPMYEIKECECCQGPIRLRLSPGKLPDYLAKPSDEAIAPASTKAPTR